ncbi:hypothetical protein L1887_45789 [Cichorium endivia]|nr:hypothetical protein L1887_45789 [Cichorium endivia]
MLLGAIIGAERQWRQRMAGLRTNALVATGAAVFILSSVSTSPDSPGRIAAQIVSGIGFLGAGVIMREGMNIRGLNTAATLWCSAGIGVLCGLGQFWNAAMASLIILCANILLREAAQRINQLPVLHEGEKCYVLKITCNDEHEDAVRQSVEGQMYNSILVPIDISEDSLTHMVIPFVQAHTALNTAKVHFLTVIPSLPYYSSLGLAYSVEMPKLKEFQHAALAKLDEIVKQFKIPPDKIQTHAVTGSPKDQILKLADTIDADLIIIASHKPDISTYLLGSNAAAVVRHAKCPVLVVR